MSDEFKFDEGYKSGNLVVVDRFISGKNHNTKFYTLKCRCKPLVNLYITEDNLASGEYTKCPFFDEPLPALLNNVENKHNDLMVIGIYLGYSDNKVARINTFGYMLKCVCGTMYPISYKRYISTNFRDFQSCGCKKHEYLVGNKYNKLTVLNINHDENKQKYTSICQCSCGNVVHVPVVDLLKRKVSACDECTAKLIKNKELVTSVNQINIDGNNLSKLNKCWHNMRKRCEVPSDDHFASYGGRGIKVCDEWKNKEEFYKWALAHGYKDGYTIERIDIDDDYCPYNCTWIPREEQYWNKKDSIRTSSGIALMALCGPRGISAAQLQHKLRRQTPDEAAQEIITYPIIK